MRILGQILALLGLVACAQPQPPMASAVPGGVEISASIPIDRVTLRDGQGAPLSTRRLPAPTRQVSIPLRWTPGQPINAEVHSGEKRWEIPVDVPASMPPALLSVEAPLGQGGVALEDGAVLPLAMSGPARLGLLITSVEPVTVRASLAGQARAVLVTVPGQREALTWDLAAATLDSPLDVQICPEASPCTALHATLRQELLSAEEAGRRLSLDAVRFPADPVGGADPSRPADRVDLPSPWWRAVLRRTGLGYRPRDDSAPWAYNAVTLENHSALPINAVVRARVLGPDGQQAPAFAPRLRDNDDGTGNISVLLRVPAQGRATAALPVFVDESEVENGLYTRQVEVIPLGAAEPLHTWRGPLGVHRGNTVASAGFGLSLLASAAGLTMLVRRTRGWLAEAATSELMSIALFGSLMFVVAVLSQLVAMIAAGLLGPFASLGTGLIDDALRTTLFATLLCLLPRPGVASLALCTSYLLRLLALGSMGPVDLLFVGGHALWLEGALWVSGITRHRDWLTEGRLKRWARLVVAFAGSSAILSATGLVLSAVLYRLYYADWYVMLLIALPGFLYPTIAVGFAVGFADSLRRVES